MLEALDHGTAEVLAIPKEWTAVRTRLRLLGRMRLPVDMALAALRIALPLARKW
jgi:hypothetical protein